MTVYTYNMPTPHFERKGEDIVCAPGDRGKDFSEIIRKIQATRGPE